ncbi:MAG: N-(5'-phosphoribosyl)anthranilate isomerase, partial [Calditrichaeota bacterium]|nr:N-(5'-phosphoribosyl)anthranilate isomerase [Calditrichota bacterium]
MNLRVKICGITRLADAELAAELGADALGFVFFEKSPRNITFADAAKIIEKLPTHIRKIGVFVNPKYAFAAEAVRIAGLDAIQLHGIYGDANFLKINDLP